jgi:hypothetical protein
VGIKDRMGGIRILTVHMAPAIIAAAIIAAAFCRRTPLGRSAFQVARFFLQRHSFPLTEVTLILNSWGRP